MVNSSAVPSLSTASPACSFRIFKQVSANLPHLDITFNVFWCSLWIPTRSSCSFTDVSRVTLEYFCWICLAKAWSSGPTAWGTAHAWSDRVGSPGNWLTRVSTLCVKAAIFASVSREFSYNWFTKRVNDSRSPMLSNKDDFLGWILHRSLSAWMAKLHHKRNWVLRHQILVNTQNLMTRSTWAFLS